MHKGVRQAKWRTSVKRNTLTPVFNESFQFDLSEMNIDDITLEFIVVDYDCFTKDDWVGEAIIGKNALSQQGRLHWTEVLASPHSAITNWHSIISTPFSKAQTL